jgi:hypothetical protein
MSFSSSNAFVFDVCGCLLHIYWTVGVAVGREGDWNQGLNDDDLMKFHLLSLIKSISKLCSVWLFCHAA